MNDSLDAKTSGLDPMPVDPPKSITPLSPKVMIALPWQKSAHPITSFAVSQLVDKRRTASMLCFGDAFVAHSRNHCVDEFLKTDATHVLFIDDDMIPQFGNSKWFRTYTGWDWYPDPFASFNVIDRLLSHKKSVVGACYFGRQPEGPPVFSTGATSAAAAEHARKGPHDQLLHSNWVGTGCILIHRKVFEDIEKKFPLLARGPGGNGGQWFTSSEHNLMDGVRKTHAFLAEGPMDGIKALKAYEMLDGLLGKIKQTTPLAVGEDVVLCRRAAECGHDVFVDLGLICGHIGHCTYGPRNTRPKSIQKL